MSSLIIKNHRWPIAVVALLVLLCIAALSLKVGFAAVYSLIISFLFSFLLPGFMLALLIWPKVGEIPLLVRIVSSVALSIVVAPLIIFYSNQLLHLPVNRSNIIAEVGSFSILVFAMVCVRSYYFERKHRTTAKNDEEYIVEYISTLLGQRNKLKAKKTNNLMVP